MSRKRNTQKIARILENHADDEYIFYLLNLLEERHIPEKSEMLSKATHILQISYLLKDSRPAFCKALLEEIEQVLMEEPSLLIEGAVLQNNAKRAIKRSLKEPA